MTDIEILEEFKQQHLKTYKKAVEEIIKNNTKGLVEEDIFSLVKKPPLDSMDSIKSKLLSLAKSAKIILDTEALNILVEDFRTSLKDRVIGLKDIREKLLIKKIEEFEPKRETEIITITTKDLTGVNKELKKEVKTQVKTTVKELQKDLENIHVKETSSEQKQQINEQFIKYMNGSYQKQLLDSIAMKTMIKDRTLISGVNEQGERYLFTKTNSHIFDEEKKGATK